MIVYNYATSTIAPATPVIAAVLDLCKGWRTIEEIARALPAQAAVVRRLVAALRSRSFLHQKDDKIDPRERAMARRVAWKSMIG